MKKKFSQKGFTLIELLAVIVILGVIMLIAVPSISTVITNSRKDSFIQTADQYISAVRNMAVAGTVEYQVSPSNVTVVSVKGIELEGKAGANAQSPFGALWNGAVGSNTQAYVIIWNTATAAEPRYTYYFAGVDGSNNCMEIKEEKTATRSDVTTVSAGCNVTVISKSGDTVSPTSISLTKPGETNAQSVPLDAAHVYLG